MSTYTLGGCCSPIRSLSFFENRSALYRSFSTDVSLCASLNEMAMYGPYQKKRPPNLQMDGKPFMKAIVLKTLIRKPKKPNSANRKCVRIRLSNGREVVAFVPGEGHNLQEHNLVLVRGGRCQDLIGVKHKVVRGAFDCAKVQKKQRSSYLIIQVTDTIFKGTMASAIKTINSTQSSLFPTSEQATTDDSSDIILFGAHDSPKICSHEQAISQDSHRWPFQDQCNGLLANKHSTPVFSQVRPAVFCSMSTNESYSSLTTDASTTSISSTSNSSASLFHIDTHSSEFDSSWRKTTSQSSDAPTQIADSYDEERNRKEQSLMERHFFPRHQVVLHPSSSCSSCTPGPRSCCSSDTLPPSDPSSTPAQSNSTSESSPDLDVVADATIDKIIKQNRIPLPVPPRKRSISWFYRLRTVFGISCLWLSAYLGAIFLQAPALPLLFFAPRAFLLYIDWTMHLWLVLAEVGC
ncbi:unnamed protein product [Protopolystoma xenopodis]|uniref:Small ribosomal subunit protein uS12m n=1 Tax=Protopolystoma xenopodis TaxID=117903 RepID=A0A448WLV9_9PLAT|nr:unnamed protein product [Protopolystoma xenopodis]